MNQDFEIVDREPEVIVVEGPSVNPIIMAGAAAHICYYPPTPATVSMPHEVPLEKVRKTAAYTLGSSHLTTWAHSPYTFAINYVSRLYINEVLHDHPFYNSNQISGRYRIFDLALIRIPPFESRGNKTEVYRLYKKQFKAYHDIIPLLEEDLKEMGPRRPDDRSFRVQDKYSRIEKMAIEAARHVIPAWQLSAMFHDANGLVVLRYYAMQNIVTTSWEHRNVVSKMGDAISEFENQKILQEQGMNSLVVELRQLAKQISEEIRYDLNLNPSIDNRLSNLLSKHSKVLESMESRSSYQEKLFDFFDDIASSNPEILPVSPRNSALQTLYEKLSRSSDRSSIINSYIENFERELNGHRSKLVSFLPDAERILADAVRMTNPMISLNDEDAIGYAMNPAKNPVLNHPFNLEIHDPLGQAMNSIFYRFKKKCSWVADSQLIRHRTSRGQRPDPRIVYTDKPDVMIPQLIERNKEAIQIFEEINQEAWEVQNMLIESGEEPEFAIGVKPQAMVVRWGETSNLSDLRHRFKQRTCLRAQEEAWNVSTDELVQIYETHPTIGRYLGPPCIPRSLGNITPQCDQGYLWCGLPVWAKWGNTKKIQEISYYPTERKVVVEKYPSKIKSD